jgi:hypothetical protein
MRELIQEFHKDPEPPSIQTWNENLKRWAENAGLSHIHMGFSNSIRLTVDKILTPEAFVFLY